MLLQMQQQGRRFVSCPNGHYSIALSRTRDHLLRFLLYKHTQNNNTQLLQTDITLCFSAATSKNKLWQCNFSTNRFKALDNGLWTRAVSCCAVYTAVDWRFPAFVQLEQQQCAACCVVPIQPQMEMDRLCCENRIYNIEFTDTHVHSVYIKRGVADFVVIDSLPFFFETAAV